MEFILNELMERYLIKDTAFKSLDNATNHSLVYLLNGSEGPLVLKEIQQDWLNEEKLNAQGLFVDKMIKMGAPFARIIQFENGDYFIKEDKRLFTLETYVEGIEKEDFSKEICLSLAQTLGRLHVMSEQLNFKFDYDGPWSIEYDQNVFSEAICEKEEFVLKMIHCLKGLNYDEHLLNEMLVLFNDVMYCLKNDLRSLPKGAVQGDLSLDNIRFNERLEVSGIFDYNIAGDEVYVWEFINQIAWYQEFIKEEIELKPLMVSAYKEERSLSEREEALLNKYLEFVKYTRFSKCIEIQYFAKENQPEKVNPYIQQFASLLNELVSN